MSICDDARQAGTDKLHAAYTPLIDEITRVIRNMQKRQLDPRNYYDAANDKSIDLIAWLSDLGTTRDKQLNDLNKKIDSECVQTQEFLQHIIDLVVLYITDGFSAVLPKYVTHVDVGEILAGKPLGGDNSVFNQIRGGILNGIGLGENNDLRNLIQDPPNVIKNAVNDALEKAGLPFRL